MSLKQKGRSARGQASEVRLGRVGVHDFLRVGRARILRQFPEENIDKLRIDVRRVGKDFGELSSLRLEDVSSERFSTKDPKTPSGIREIPIHKIDANSLVAFRRLQRTGPPPPNRSSAMFGKYRGKRWRTSDQSQSRLS